MGTAVPLALFPFDHVVLLVEHFSKQAPEQGAVSAFVTMHHRQDPPQLKKKEKKAMVFSRAEDLAPVSLMFLCH